MLKNYLKISIRNIIKYRGYSFITIAGLSLGLTCCILIFLIVQDELNYDKFHENSDYIYRVINSTVRNGEETFSAITPAPLAASLKDNHPEISNAACFNYAGGGIARYKDKLFKEGPFCFTDNDFFQMFSFKFLRGDPESTLDNPNSVVITDETAQKYFGDKEPLGETLTINNIINVQVTGVIAKPENSHLQLKFIFPNSLYKAFGVDIASWNRFNYTTYIMLHKNSSVELFRSNVAGHLLSVYGHETTYKLYLQPLNKIYLYSDYAYDVHTRTSDIRLVYIISAIGILVLIIACINFMNLSTARSEKRIKEVGLRKVVGAQRKQLIIQFLGEALFITFCALLFSITAVYLLLTVISNLFQKNLSLNILSDPSVFTGIFGIALLTGLAAGSYPAFFLSSFQPIRVLKGFFKKGSQKSLLRKILVITQFSFSGILIICTLILAEQITFMRNMKLGYDKEHLLCLRISPGIRKNYDAVKNELLQNPDIDKVTAGMNLPNWAWPSIILSDWEGKETDKEIKMCHGSVDYDFFETFKMDIIEGRSFSPQFPTDLTSALIVNEEAVKQMDMKDPIGKQMNTWGHSGIIIGVVKNFNFDNVRNKINPVVLDLDPDQTDYLIMKLKPADFTHTIASIGSIWNKFEPDFPFEYAFLDDYLNKLYIMESVVLKIVIYITGMALFIACLGILGLASFMAEQRTKEIGVRKVLGATDLNVFYLLSKDLIKWVVIANIIAWPLAFAGMNGLLQNYANRVSINLWLFVLTGIATLLAAWMTAACQSVKASRMNPLNAIKYE